MKHITTFLAASLLCATAAPAQGPAAKELDPKVVEAWKKAGAQVGWVEQVQLGYWRFAFAKPKDRAALPAFRFQTLESGAIGKLPGPAAPFALEFADPKVTDAGLKGLGGL